MKDSVGGRGKTSASLSYKVYIVLEVCFLGDPKILNTLKKIQKIVYVCIFFGYHCF